MQLSKHHGLGNDFLVLLDPSGKVALSADVVARLCDRRRGIGADGVLRATRPASGAPSSADAVMDLHNADGSRAEMSGNGIRCLAQALVRRGWVTTPAVVISTDAGLRTVELQSAVDATTDVLAADMGPAHIGAEAPEWTGGELRRAAWADMGNPHLVVAVDGPGALAGADLVTLGEKVNAEVRAGANVHLMAAGPEGDVITMRPFERGVGPTEACGTGACAAAAVARGWGLVGKQVTVHMPGGSAEIHIGPTVRLVGPATFVAMIDTEPDEWH
ncbi:MAG: diaminopimelate epimerase [Acidimicrobiales bacterium]